MHPAGSARCRPGLTVARLGRPASGRLIVVVGAVVWLSGCMQIVHQTDQDVGRLITARQRAALGRPSPVHVETPDRIPKPGREAYRYNPSPTTEDVPAAFAEPEATPTSGPATSAPAASQPTTRPEGVFTLTNALAYAQEHQREFMTAQEDLYLSALALTLERHLWTPIFASNLRTVYGNFGQARNFDQAMRFVADLSVAQRLPYGGQFTAGAVSTLIRDVKKTLTASEGSVIALGLEIPFLRGAGHVAQENLIQLERELTYSVRVYERFRRQQLVTVAQGYFGLLTAKQRVVDTEKSLETFQFDVERARAMESTGQGTPLDTQRAELAMLTQQGSLEDIREVFRTAADNYKLLIGMPVDEPLGRDDLEDIEAIQRQIAADVYPLLFPPAAVSDQEFAVDVALQRRFDLLTFSNRIDDARRGVAISCNALLPDLNWNSSLTYDTDPNHYSLSNFSFDRATWRSEVLLSLPLERTAERNQLRRAMISVQRAQRDYQGQSDRVRAEVRRAVNNILLQQRSLEIQERAVEVARSQREYAQIQYNDGKIDNRDKIDAENALLNALNQLNLATTALWGGVLEFRLATETLRIDDDGRQEADYDLPAVPVRAQ
jgi:outer membrane protein TolC